MNRNDEVRLIRRPANEYDPNAIEVLTTDGVSLGWLPKASAAQHARYMDNRGTLYGRVLSVIGGTGGKNYGLRLRIGRSVLAPLPPDKTIAPTVGTKSKPFKTPPSGGPFHASAKPEKGQDCASALARVKKGDEVIFLRRPEHSKDCRAVEVQTSTGQSLGMLSWSHAFHFSPSLDAGHRLYGRVSIVLSGAVQLIVGWYPISADCSDYETGPHTGYRSRYSDYEYADFADDYEEDYQSRRRDEEWESPLRDDDYFRGDD